MDYQSSSTQTNVLEPPVPGTNENALDRVIHRMLGDSVPSFFSEFWGKKPLYVPGAGLDYAGFYAVDGFLADLAATQPLPYLSVGVRDGKRHFKKHETTDELRAGVQEGGVSAMKLSKFWHRPPTPERITWARALFGSLCRAASMVYMGPNRSEDVDLFLAGPHSQLGTHFDTTEVFTLQLFGERKWLVDAECHVEDTLNLYKAPGWQPAKEVGFRGKTVEFTLRPGDALYVPAYAIHRVTGVSWSVSLSLGLRAFNEIDFVESVLEMIKMSKYAEYKPALSLPAAVGDAHVEAKLALIRNVRTLLEQVEMTATGFVMGPLKLPPTLTNTSESSAATQARVLGAFTSGFALFDEPKEQRA
jgi:50S ribosomal protein L16 3-hydroxylase